MLTTMPVDDVPCRSCDMVCRKFAKLVVLPEEPLADSKLAKLCCSATWLGSAALPVLPVLGELSCWIRDCKPAASLMRLMACRAEMPTVPDFRACHRARSGHSEVRA